MRGNVSDCKILSISLSCKGIVRFWRPRRVSWFMPLDIRRGMLIALVSSQWLSLGCGVAPPGRFELDTND